MDWHKLERKLKIQFLTIKISLSVILLSLIVLMIVYTSLYLNSKEIIEVSVGLFKHQKITYNYEYLDVVLSLMIPTTILFCIWLFCILTLRFKTFDICNYNITVVNYICYQVIYVDGVKYSSKFLVIFNLHPHTIELPNGVYCYFEQPYFPNKIARVYFSDDYPPIEI